MESTLQSATDSRALSFKVVIIVLITLMGASSIVAAFFSAQGRARDEIRVKDILLLEKFLAAYKSNEGSYPISNNGQPTNWQSYLNTLPQAPAPDGNCTAKQNNYEYKSINKGQGFTLSFCLGRNLDSFSSGMNSIGSN